MMMVVLMAGIGLLLAGLVTVGLGIQMELSFGNTLILTGAIAACTGMLMISLWSVARELKKMMLRLGSGIPVESRAGAAAAANNLRHQALENGSLPSGRDQRAAEDLDDLELAAATQPAAPWDEVVTRDRGRRGGASIPEPTEAAPAAKPRRNLLFSSSRKERERSPGRMPDPSAADLGPAPQPLESNEVSPPAFEDSWSKPERLRGADAPPQRRGGRASSTSKEPSSGEDRYGPAARKEGRPGVMILKSGVVDGMAYSLYSDGSIEAQMPEGMMRFGSIEELRAHLDQRQ